MAELSRTQVLDQALSIWRRRKWAAIPTFLLPLSALVTAIMYLPSIYEATATLLVEGPQMPETMVRSTISSETESRVRSMSREILSGSRLDDLVDRFGLQEGGASREEAIERVREAISVETKSSGVTKRGAAATLAVTFQSRDPAKAAEVANALASFFVEENFKVRDRLAVGTTEFLRAQLERTREALLEQEKRIGAFRTQYLGELPQQMQANLLTLERADAALRLNQDNQSRVAQRRENLQSDLAALAVSEDVPAGSPPAAGPSAAADPELRRLLQLRQQLINLQTRFTDKYPDVIEIKTEIATLEERYAKAHPSTDGTADGTAPPPVWSPQAARLKQSLKETEAELDNLKMEERRLRNTLVTYQTRVENTPKREQEYLQIARDYQATQDGYQSMLKRLNEAQISENMEQSQKGEQFQLLSPASPPSTPDKPKRLRLLLMALFLSVALAALAVAVPEYLDSSFHTADDLRQFTTLPILTVIPRIVTDADMRRQRFRFRLGVLGTALSVMLLVAASYFLAHDNLALLSLVSR